MKKGLLCFILSVALVLGCTGYSWSDEDALTIMHPDRETRLKWIRSYEDAPLAPIDPVIQSTIPPRGSLSLLSHLNYVAADRNQGGCGNCWAWAGTGVMGIDLDIQEGIFDRLSVQYINSCASSVIGKACCDGGWLYHLADFYTSTGQAIPWSNTNAHWQDGDESCDTSCGSISTSPNYPINSISEQTITTQGVAQATAITNIKNVLHQNKAVWFGFFMPKGTDWGNFRTFWQTQTESVIWNPNFSCGGTWDAGGGGHAVLCVGYNDDDPDNSYWIMLNSWSLYNRPNGLFRLDMDMDYSCTYFDVGEYWSFYWQTLDIDWGTMNCCTKPTLQTPTGNPPTYMWSCSGSWEWFWVYVMNLSTGDVYDSGWVNDPGATSWASTTTLPWGNYRAWVSVYDSDCGLSEWSDYVDFTVGDICAKPTLQTPTGNPPTYTWSCAGSWEWYWVYVQNLSTGAVYESGWVNDPGATSWASTTTLPWGNYRAWVIVYHPQGGLSEWSDYVDFTVGNICAKPTLQTPSGNQPTYQWSCGAGQWEWFWVYVTNLSTGAYYGSDWVNSSANTWTSTYTLPAGYYRAWVSVYGGGVLSEWSDPQDWTVGGGGVASLRFYNNLQCGGSNFTATFTFGGQAFNSVSGNWSNCDTFTPGTYSWSLYADAGGCGTLTGSGSYTVAAGNVYNFVLTLDASNNPVIGVNVQTGDCSTPTPWAPGISLEILQTFPGEGFTQAE